MKKLVTAIALTLISVNLGISQEVEEGNCITDEVMRQKFNETPGLEEQTNAYYQELYRKVQEQIALQEATGLRAVEDPKTITVVWHIVHEYGSENVSDSRIYSEMVTMNNRFNANSSDASNLLFPYDTMNANTGITFKLAAIDPFGNCTNGIVHHYSHLTNSGGEPAKLYSWDRTRYLNIWVVDELGSPGAAAYATPPQPSIEGDGFWADGVISRNSFIGFNSITISHEVAHCFGLPHTFAGNDLINGSPTTCVNDGIYDTPQTKGDQNCSRVYPYGWRDCEEEVISSDTLTWFTFDSLTTGTMDMTPAPSPQNTILGDTGLVFTNVSAVGVGSAPASAQGTFGFDGWGTGAANDETVYANLTGAINTAQYYEFSLDVIPGTIMNLTDLKFDVARDATGPRTFAVRSSNDGFAANLPVTIAPANADLSVQAGDVVFYNYDSTYSEANSTFNLTGIGELMGPVTFRIYAWNAEDAAGDFIIDNMRINGDFGRIEDVQNYMNYSGCRYHFTPGQSTFMHVVLNEIAAHRNDLWTDSTLISTGVMNLVLPQNPLNELSVPLCEPIVDFTTTKHAASDAIQQITCVGKPLQFYDASYNAVIDSWEWTFSKSGATPITSTDMDPLVTFPSSGYWNVTLTVSNDAGSSTETRNQWIYVADNWAEYYGPNTLNVDSHPEWFRVLNPEQNPAKFQVSNTNGYNNSKCFKLNNYRNIQNPGLATDDYFYYTRLAGNKDFLITPSFDLRQTTGVTVDFKYAYATNATSIGGMTEELQVFYSRNCGESWLPAVVSVEMTPGGGYVPVGQSITEEKIVTAGFAGYADYAPTSNQDWRNARFNFSANSSDSDVRFMFKYIASNNSSNLYIDDIAVNGTLGITSEEISSLDVNVYPNPTSTGQALTVTYNAQNNPVEFILKDAQGKIVAQEVVNKTNTQVTHTLNGTDNLNAACYFLEVVSGDHKTTRKIVVL